jgi:flavin-dependent dehydrogenase
LAEIERNLWDLLLNSVTNLQNRGLSNIMNDITVIGGGLSGLVSAYLLRKEGLSVQLIEKKSYPFHRVCGEYVSNEVIPFLENNGLFPEICQPVNITEFQFTSIKGQSIEFPLDLGGFGISRYAFDDFLYKKCLEVGVEFKLGKSVDSIRFDGDSFEIQLQDGTVSESNIVIGAFGKRSTLDRKLNRAFMHHPSPYIGVKYHIKIDHPKNLIALHNFNGGYCGISNVEDGTTNLCYLGKRSFLRKYGTIPKMEEAVLFENPHLRDIFDRAEFILNKPLVINEISFETKQPVEEHILMAGDAAGMITPLCGNGMAIAIRSAKVLSDCVTRYFEDHFNRSQLENEYREIWMRNFNMRLWTGRKIQNLFGRYQISNIAVNMAKLSPGFRNTLMKKTHGLPF